MKYLVLTFLLLFIVGCGNSGGGSADSSTPPVATPTNNPDVSQPSLTVTAPVVAALAGTYTAMLNVAVYDLRSSNTWTSSQNPPAQCPSDTFSSIVIGTGGQVESVTAWDGMPASDQLSETLRVGNMSPGILLGNAYDISTGAVLIIYGNTGCALVYECTP